MGNIKMFKIKVTYPVLEKYYGNYYRVIMANIRKDIKDCPFLGFFGCTASKGAVCKIIKRKICEVGYNI